jgi:putative ABC transport system ATP-binding protein
MTAFLTCVKPARSPASTAPPPTDGAAATGGTIELRRLSKVYHEGEGERVVLRDVDAVVGPGQFVVLLGRSGSGKSTLLNLISGIDEPTSGEVRVGATPVTRLSERARTLFRRRHVGFVFQFFNLIPTLTVEENLLLPLELTGRTGPGARATALGLLAEVGLAERASAYPERLSGGEQQRVAVARAVVHGPALILADEPTGNLDAESARQVLTVLDGLRRRHGKTLIVVTHSTEVARLADRVFALENGRLIEQRGPRTAGTVLAAEP